MADPEPFWQEKPSIPFEPINFCMTAESLMSSLPNATNFRCQGELLGGLGARVDVSNIQIVLLQGAKAEWFMFAYERAEGGRSVIDDMALRRLKSDFEHALHTGEAE